MKALQKNTARMLEIERINMAYNEATNFGRRPNGKEAEIAALLQEWDELKALRSDLKYSQNMEED